MRIISLDVENFMALKAVRITPTGNVVQITGKNKQGKSAVINALYAALFGKRYIPKDPVHHGATEARIRLDLGEVIVGLVIDPDGDSELRVTAPSGARFPSPQKVLASLLDYTAFDPSEFVRMTPKQQRDTLAQLMGLSDLLAGMTAAHQADFENRTSINRRAKELQALVDAVQWDGHAVARVDVADVMQEIRAIEQHNQRVDQQDRARSAALALIQKQRLQIAANRAQAERLLDEADVVEREADAAEANLAPIAEARRDTAALQQRIVDAQTLNERARKIDEHVQLRAQLDALRTESEELTVRMKQREQEKADVVAHADTPIPGIGFNDDGVTLHGVPFEQGSTAEKLLVSAEIGMAGKPALRLMVVRDASAFDSESWKTLERLADARGYMVIAERPTDGGNVGIVIRAGEVVSFEHAA